MDLKNLPDVVIDPRGGYKFVTCEVTDKNGNSKIVVRARENADYHREIVRQLKMEAVELNVYCLGGGRINVNSETKTISIWSSSGDFGVEPNREETTAKLLQKAYPDFKIEVGSEW